MFWRLGASCVVAAALAGTMSAAASDMPTIAPGVRVGSIPVGELTSGWARARLDDTVTRRLPVVYNGRVWTFTRWRLGATPELNGTLADALKAKQGERVPFRLSLNRWMLGRAVKALAADFNRPAIDAQLLGLDDKGRPRISDESRGRAVRIAAAERLLVRALARGQRRPIQLPVKPLIPKVTRAAFGSVIVIDRASNTLRLFDGRRLVRKFGVATGQARYPTPSGTFEIVRMEENPWWYPPPSDWARGLSPVPPGPGNPLGTRWMGLTAPGVGIHGTPSDASIGYSASHGCIRMHIPEAVWLFQHVKIGTPVVIV
jgi:lipoprotein-anchoring transpeptidase ErfK/SrfK